MKPLVYRVLLACVLVTNAHMMTIDEALDRFLKGEHMSEEEVNEATGRFEAAVEAKGVANGGSQYLNDVKMSILSPALHGGWPIRSELMTNERSQKKTYEQLKAIYDKSPTPVVAYALVCPAMFTNHFEILPELIKKIEENMVLKAHFDHVYSSYWKPRLDPDF